MPENFECKPYNPSNQINRDGIPDGNSNSYSDSNQQRPLDLLRVMGNDDKFLKPEPEVIRLQDSAISSRDPYYHPQVGSDFDPRRQGNHNLNPVSDFMSGVSFTLSMPVILAASFDIATRNRNCTATRSVLKTYGKACQFTGRSIGQGIKNYYHSDLHKRFQNAWKAFKEPLPRAESKGEFKIEIIDPDL